MKCTICRFRGGGMSPSPRYGTAPVHGWAAIVPREGWTEDGTERLRSDLEKREAPY